MTNNMSSIATHDQFMWYHSSLQPLVQGPVTIHRSFGTGPQWETVIKMYSKSNNQKLSNQISLLFTLQDHLAMFQTPKFKE